MSVLRQVKSSYEELNPTLVLISLSPVNPNLKSQLSFENVEILEFNNDEESLLSDLVALLAKATDDKQYPIVYPEVWYDRGQALMELRRYEGAVAAFHRALRLRPYPKTGRISTSSSRRM